jgi:hypothetical protein
VTTSQDDPIVWRDPPQRIERDQAETPLERHAVAEREYSQHMNNFPCGPLCLVRRARNDSYQDYTGKPHVSVR